MSVSSRADGSGDANNEVHDSPRPICKSDPGEPPAISNAPSELWYAMRACERGEAELAAVQRVPSHVHVSPNVVPVGVRPPNTTTRCSPVSKPIAWCTRAGGPSVARRVQIAPSYSHVSPNATLGLSPLPPNNTERPRARS